MAFRMFCVVCANIEYPFGCFRTDGWYRLCCCFSIDAFCHTFISIVLMPLPLAIAIQFEKGWFSLRCSTKRLINLLFALFHLSFSFQHCLTAWTTHASRQALNRTLDRLLASNYLFVCDQKPNNQQMRLSFYASSIMFHPIYGARFPRLFFTAIVFSSLTWRSTCVEWWRNFLLLSFYIPPAHKHMIIICAGNKFMAIFVHSTHSHIHDIDMYLVLLIFGNTYE